jgi:hypothetical protein
MKNLGKWIPWYPLERMSDKYNIKSYVSNFDNLKIVLSKRGGGGETEIHISFGGSHIFRKMNESWMSRLWLFLEKTHKNFDKDWYLFKVEDSEYLKYLSEVSEGLIPYLGFKHYFIMDNEWSFDVVSQMQPRVELFIDEISVEKSEWRKH